MRFSDLLRHKFQQYSYQKRRDFSRYKKGNHYHSVLESIIDFMDDLDDMDDYIGEKIEEIEEYLPRHRK